MRNLTHDKPRNLAKSWPELVAKVGVVSSNLIARSKLAHGHSLLSGRCARGRQAFGARLDFARVARWLGCARCF
jgi:hypothetical protein